MWTLNEIIYTADIIYFYNYLFFETKNKLKPIKPKNKTRY